MPAAAPHQKTTIASLLLENGKITPEQMRYAQRIHEKLSTGESLLETLLKLSHDQDAGISIDDSDIRETIRKAASSIRLGDLLTERGYITEDDLQVAIKIQQENKTKERLGNILIQYNFIDEHTLAEVLSIQMGFPLIEPTISSIDKSLYQKIPEKVLLNNNFIPIRREEKKVVVAFSDPLDQEAQQLASRFLGAAISPVMAQESSIRKLIDLIITKKSVKPISVDNSTVVGIVNAIVIAAINNNASDVHIEPTADDLQVRFRIDGVLTHYKRYPKDIIPALSSRIKILCKADIAEKRRHQGGRILFEYEAGELDLRISFFVTIHGEKIVFRLLNRQQEVLDLQAIGLAPKILSEFLTNGVHQPSGVMLVTGPTGSGKTSTLYSCINVLNTPQVSIVTAEEPVESVIEGIAQCSINPKIDLTFEETLRHIVRQDPDIILIGEIRDNYSADVALQAALTGHKVLSTFHAEDTIGTLIRLLNMGIPSFMLSSTLTCVLAQRLLRRVCPQCRTSVKPTSSQLQRLKSSNQDLRGATFMRGKGCDHCRQTGYKGRVGIFEMLLLDDRIREAILNNATSYEIRNIAIEQSGMLTLFEDGILKAARGTTTLDEVIRLLPVFGPPRHLATIRKLSGE